VSVAAAETIAATPRAIAGTCPIEAAAAAAVAVVDIGM
jgi:hypothetical protein